MIYEISSHEKPILRDYLLITETAQLTDKGERGDLYWKKNTVFVRACVCVCVKEVWSMCMYVHVCVFFCVCVHVNRKNIKIDLERKWEQYDFVRLCVCLKPKGAPLVIRHYWMHSHRGSQETKTLSSNIHTITLSPSRGCGPFNSCRNTYSSKRLCPGPA